MKKLSGDIAVNGHNAVFGEGHLVRLVACRTRIVARFSSFR